MSRRPLILAGIALTILLVVIYGASLRNRFVDFDDGILITKNPIAQGVSIQNLQTAFSSYDPELYIPLTFVGYQVDASVAGMSPFVFHLHNLILHIINALLVIWLVFLLTKNRWIAIVCGLLFAIHPIQTEAVAWAAARKDLQSATFFLASLIAYINYQTHNRKWIYWLSVGLFALGLLSKVTIIVLPLILLLIDDFETRKWSVRSLWEKAPYFALSILFGVIALFGKTDALTHTTLFQRILLGCRSVMLYLGKIVWPHGFSVLYPYTSQINGGSPDLLLSFLVVIAVIGLAWYARKWTREIFFAVSFFLLLVIPSWNNVSKGEGFLDVYLGSDRYVYLASIALFFMIGSLVWNARKWLQDNKKIVIDCVGLIMCGVLAFLAFGQSLVWANTETLFRHALAYYPNSQLAHNNVGNYYRDEGKPDLAMKEYQASIAIRPTARTWYNVGLMYTDQKNIPAAKDAYQKALALDANHAQANVNLGAILWGEGDIDGAIMHFQKATQTDPTFETAFFNLGVLYEKKSQWNDAITILTQATHLSPTDADAWGKLAVAYAKIGNRDQALAAAHTALAIDPAQPDALQIGT